MTGIILEKQRKYDSVYLTIVSGVGLSLIVWGLIQFPTYEQPLNFVLLLLLAAIAEVAATLTAVEGDKIAYEVGTAIGLGAVPFYGPSLNETGSSLLLILACTVWPFLWLERSS